MALRLAAVAIVSSLIFSAPSTAGAMEVELDVALALPEIEPVTHVPLELVSSDGAVLAQLPPVHPPGALALTTDRNAAGIIEVASELEAERPGREIDVYASLEPTWFIDRNEGETFAMIAADLAAAGDLITGSIARERPDQESVTGTGEHAALSGADFARSPLVDDAIFLEQPIP